MVRVNEVNKTHRVVDECQGACYGGQRWVPYHYAWIPSRTQREPWYSDHAPSSEFRHVSESQDTCLLSTQKK